MPVLGDLEGSAVLCKNGANAAMDKLIGLGPRPIDNAGAEQWDHQDAVLKNQISVLANLSSTLSALIVSKALQDVWPKLDGLGQITTDVQAKIKTISDIAQAAVRIATIVDFGVAVVALATTPSADAAKGVYEAFKKVSAS
jgi:hypothetical protein